jgi:6-phosphogluconate dehydrogenase (decarboxylating)
MKIGFIGLGAMGRGIAGRLVAAGHEVLVWNRSRPPVDELAGKGARAASSLAEAARSPPAGRISIAAAEPGVAAQRALPSQLWTSCQAMGPHAAASGVMALQ